MRINITKQHYDDIKNLIEFSNEDFFIDDFNTDVVECDVDDFEKLKKISKEIGWDCW